MAPSLSFRGQPFRDEDTAGAFLGRVLADPALTSLTVVVAWARFGGLRRFKAELEAFRRRGGRFRAIVGIDEGGATRPGLSLAVDLADEAYVFHDRQSRTFHPKLCLAEGPGRAVLLVGSSNMTAGGLFSNYEASLEAEFELPGEEEAEALVGVREYVAKLLEDEQLCLPLDEALLERLVESPKYAISGGERRGRSSAVDGEDLFGASRHEKAVARELPAEARAELEELEAEVDVAAEGELDVSQPPVPAATWTKRLRKTDAQHPPSAKSNPVGSARLTKARHKISSLTWFREELFGPAAWSAGRDSKDNPIETATVSFLVSIDGQSHGLVDLKVDHAPHRVSDQDNHATVLHWGDLSPLLRDTDYTGHTLTLQRMSDGSYRLDISP